MKNILLIPLFCISLISSEIVIKDENKTNEELIAEFMLLDQKIEKEKQKTKDMKQLSKTINKLSKTLGAK
jgi:predicted RNase H-like nuclease (RuvC/YqgF family)